MNARRVSPKKRSAPIRKKTPLREKPSPKAPALPQEDLTPYFDSPIDLLCIGDRDAIFQKLNPQWETTLGYPLSEMKGKDFIEFIHPDDKSAALEAFRDMDKHPNVQTLTNRVRSKNGTYRWLEWKYILRGEHIYATARDITDHKQTEDDLRESRQVLETILNNIPIRVFWKDRRSVYLGCNRSFVEDAGFDSPEEIIGRDDYGLGWNDDAGKYQADDRLVIETGREKLQFEELQHLANGGKRWISTSKVPLRDPGGTIWGVLGTYEDVSEQKQTETALRESEERYRRISRTITDYIYHVEVEDGKPMETFHGRRCQAITGYSAEEFAADPSLWLRMVDPEDRPLAENQAQRILSNQETPAIEHRLWRKDGVRRWVRNTPVLHRDLQGRLLSYDELIQDITERKEAELQIRTLHDLALALNATTNIEEGLRLCLDAALRVSGMESGGIYLRDENSGMFDLIVHQGLAPELRAVVGHLDPDRPEANWIMEGQPVYRDNLDLTTHPEGVAPPYREFHSLIGIPIRYEERIIGCISLVSITLGNIPHFIRETLEIMVAQIGNAVARLRFEAALRESEDRYRHLFDSESDAIFLADGVSGQILEANNAACALYGYSRAELLTMKNSELSSEPDKILRLDQASPTVPEEVIVIPIRMHRKKDGTVFPVEITARPFTWQGKRVAIAAARDITLRNKMEAELRESRQMLEIVLNTIPARVFWKDRDLIYEGCNRAFAQDAGFQSPEEVVGIDDYKIGWGEHVEEYQSDDRMVIETGTAKLNYEEAAINSEGRRFWVSTSKIPLRDPQGNIHGILGTYEDITERKQAEEEIRALNAELEQRVAQRTVQLEAANKEMEAFSYSVSHDLRAPLRAIDGFTRVLEEDYGKSLDEEGRRLCAIVRTNTRHMNELIDDLLALSRLSRAEMESFPSDMEPMVRSVFQELTTPENRPRIEFHLSPLPPVTGDPILLRQVWTNLISNAIKFSAKRDRPRIDVEFQGTAEEDIFSVRDNGAGFDMQYADRLFGVFQRLHTTAEFEGIGVGLAIVQRIIHRHGGRVWAEGEPDKGAVFYFSLPKINSENNGPASEP